ncbi:hypothetical protein FJZ53_05105 [Candidatus Woesearchaeota archaeon]|nr:hypothetical protein [Candidatus Woesearchaeota archaeon]
MKLKNTLKRIVFYGTLLAGFNYYALPLATSVGTWELKKEATNPKVQKVCQTDKYLEDILASIDRQTVEPLQLLKAAHAIASKKLDYRAGWHIGKRSAYKGSADCKYFSLFTYSNYLYLADQIGKPSMKDKVRLNMGYKYDGKKVNYGHTWLQVLIDDKWCNYETTIDNIRKNETINFKELDKKIPDEKVLEDGKEIATSCIQEENGSLKNHTNYNFTIETGADLKTVLKGRI